MKWFKNPKTAEELKKQYKQLAVKYHPDLGGSTKDMQEINDEYDILFARLKDIHTTADGETYTAREESRETPDEFKDIINAIIKLDGIQIELCGSWIWLTGNTFPHREILKHLNFRFSKSKTAWYFHTEGYRKNNNKKFTLDEIRDLYGSEMITTKPQLKLEIV